MAFEVGTPELSRPVPHELIMTALLGPRLTMKGLAHEEQC